MDDMKKTSEEELVQMAKSGNSEVMDFLLERYKVKVRQKAKAMYLLGGDTDDLIQEGMIGLFKALRDYDKTKQASFQTFADLCISRQMYSAVEASRRKKHGPLNSYISLNAGADGEEDIVLEEKIAGPSMQDPQELLIDQENVASFFQRIEHSLSTMEMQVLNQYLQGMDYHQIADKLGKSDKAIDNALQRIRKKVQEITT